MGSMRLLLMLLRVLMVLGLSIRNGGSLRALGILRI